MKQPCVYILASHRHGTLYTGVYRQDGRLHCRPSAVEKPMVEQRKPIVTELALADALDQLVNLIEVLRADENLRVEITTDETELVKLTFAGTPDMGFPLQREDRDIPAEIVRRVWNEGLRDYDTPYRSGDAVSDHWRQ